MPKLDKRIAPGRYSHEGITLLKLAQMYSDKQAARAWCVQVV